MDRTSTWVLLLVVLLGGFTALYADRLGRNLGKKRLKLGSLRPRRTAEVIVFTAGMLTPLIAIAAIMLVSAEARQWIKDGYRAVQEARKAVEDRKDAIRKLERTQNSINSLNLQLDDLRRTLDGFRKQSSQYETQAKTAQQRASEATGKAVKLGAQVGVLTKRVESKQIFLDSLQGALDDTAKRLATAQQSFQRVNKDRDEAYDRINELNGQIETLEGQLKTGKGDLDQVRQDLETKKGELATAKAQQTEALASYQRDLEGIKQELQTAQQSLDVVNSQIRLLAEKALTEPLIFRSGEEIFRLPVQRQMNRAEAQHALDSVLRYARVYAADRGASQGPEGSEAGLIDIPDKRTNTVYTSQRQIADLTTSLIGQPTERVIVARAMFNSFGHQFVPIAIQVLPNPVVFQEGELLGEARIDNNLSIGRMIEAIGTLLQDQVKRKAEDRRMIPASGRDDAYGSVAPDEIYSLVTQIQGYGRSVRLQVLAKQDTRAGGPLALEFRLK